MISFQTCEIIKAFHFSSHHLYNWVTFWLLRWLFHTYTNQCFCLQTFLLDDQLLWRWSCCRPCMMAILVVIMVIIMVIFAHPPQSATFYHIDGVQYNACNGKTNSCQIQNHVDDDLKEEKKQTQNQTRKLTSQITIKNIWSSNHVRQCGHIYSCYLSWNKKENKLSHFNIMSGCYKLGILTRHRLGNFSDKMHVMPKTMNYKKDKKWHSSFYVRSECVPFKKADRCDSFGINWTAPIKLDFMPLKNIFWWEDIQH